MEASWVVKLKAIDNSLANESKALKELISSLTFLPVIEYKLGSEIPELPPDIYQRKGIYFFELKIQEPQKELNVWIENFTFLWKNGKVTWVPGIKKRRIRAHQVLDEWIPLYLGKSKNVGGR